MIMPLVLMLYIDQITIERIDAAGEKIANTQRANC
jgi:hypothetical protein